MQQRNQKSDGDRSQRCICRPGSLPPPPRKVNRCKERSLAASGLLAALKTMAVRQICLTEAKPPSGKTQQGAHGASRDLFSPCGCLEASGSDPKSSCKTIHVKRSGGDLLRNYPVQRWMQSQGILQGDFSDQDRSFSIFMFAGLRAHARLLCLQTRRAGCSPPHV